MKRSKHSYSLPPCLAICGWLASACGDGGSSSPDAALPSVPDAPPSGAPEASGGIDTSGGLDSAGAVEAASPASAYCTGKPALASVPDLSGTWVARVAGALIINAPIVGPMRQEVVLTLLANLTQQGSEVVVDGRYCDRAQNSAPGALSQIVIPTGWAHTETPMHRTGTLAIGPEGWPVLTLPTYSESMGARVASLDEGLPTVPDDPRVYDQDNDGNPGVTVILTGTALSGSLYAVQFQTTAISAVAVAPDRMEGALTFTSAQTVLGSDPTNLASLYKLGGESKADPVICNSSFVMVKVADAPVADGGAIACEWVRANETALFGQ